MLFYFNYFLLWVAPDILKKPLLYEVTDIVQYIMSLLEKESINDLPPGGGIFAKLEIHSLFWMMMSLK